MNFINIIIAILIFGLLIFIHEGGHFLFARLFRVTIEEFAIGMGPKIISKKSKKSGIVYSLRALPIGGFVSMVGEDGESDDENAFNKKPVWQRMIITAAGALVNIIAGILVMTLLVAFSSGLLSTNVIAEFKEDAKNPSSAYGLQVGDEIISVNGTKVHIAEEVYYEIMHDGVEPIDIVVKRNGELVTVKNVEFAQVSENGALFGEIDFSVYGIKKSFGEVIRHSFYRSTLTIKMIWESLFDLVTGRYGLEAVSGPIGVTSALANSIKSGIANFIYLSVVISMNLGVMNLLPFPALDGGRLLFQLIELITKKPVNRNVEAKIHFVGIVILMLLMAVIVFKDVITLFK